MAGLFLVDILVKRCYNTNTEKLGEGHGRSFSRLGLFVYCRRIARNADQWLPISLHSAAE